MKNLAAAALVAFLALPVAAQNRDSLIDECANERNVFSSQIQRDACSALLNSGQLSAAQRAAAYGLRLLAWRAEGFHRFALEDADEWLRITPNDPEAHYRRGVVLSEMTHFQEAIASFDRALRIQPGAADALADRGTAYAGLGQHERAMRDFAEALRLDPRNVLAYTNRAELHNAMGNIEAELEDLEKAAALTLENARAAATRPRRPAR